MIYKYKLIKENGEDVLYLYFDSNYEFSKSFLDKSSKNYDLKKNILNYIKDKNISFKKGKVILIVGGLLMGSILLNNYPSNYKSYSSISDNHLYENQADNTTYIVQRGDTLTSIAKKYNLTINELKEMNNLTNNTIKIGQVLKVKTNTIDLESPIIPEGTVESEVLIIPEETTAAEVPATPKTSTPSVSETPKTPETPEVTEIPKATTPEENTNTSPKNIITVYRSTGVILQIELEEYIVGVVAAEMPASFNIEALKTQALVARTYALRKISKNEILTDTVSTQAYIDVSQMKTKWGSSFNTYYNKILNAVQSTAREYITYNGSYIDAVYHSTSNGYTEDSVNVWGNSIPYLKSVSSVWDQNASSYLRTESREFDALTKILGFQISDNTNIEILSRNSSGRVSSIRIGENIYTGVGLRTLLGLRSADFDIEIIDGKVVIVTRGYGHGVGMSQYGANGMANEGYTYRQIISHYYTGVTINTL